MHSHGPRQLFSIGRRLRGGGIFAGWAPTRAGLAPSSCPAASFSAPCHHIIAFLPFIYLCDAQGADNLIWQNRIHFPPPALEEPRRAGSARSGRRWTLSSDPPPSFLFWRRRRDLGRSPRSSVTFFSVSSALASASASASLVGPCAPHLPAASYVCRFLLSSSLSLVSVGLVLRRVRARRRGLGSALFTFLPSTGSYS